MTFNPQPQVMSYRSDTPIKDLRHDRLSLGNNKASCWEEVKIKSPSKVNSRRERIRPVLTQRAEDNKAQVDLSKENIRRKQQHDPECNLIIKYLTQDMLPQSDTDAGSILLRQEDHIMIKGLLCHIFTPTGSKQSAQAQLVTYQNLKVHFLRFHHDSDLGSHVGNNKMLSSMRLKYYWVGMTRDTREYVLSCSKCKEYNRSNCTPIGHERLLLIHSIH